LVAVLVGDLDVLQAQARQQAAVLGAVEGLALL